MAQPSEGAERRNYGQGSIQELEPGLFRLRVFVGAHPVTGQPIQRSRRFRGTHPAAQRALNKLRLEADGDKQAGRRPTTSTKVTVMDVIDQHLAASRQTLAPGTLGAYDAARKLHIPVGFGRKRVDALTAQSFRDLYAWLGEQKLSDASIWKVYALLSGALTRAVREHGVAFESKLMVTPKKPVAKKRQLATKTELVCMFGAVAKFGDDWPFLFRLACATGLRRGELLAVRWSSLDDSGVLYVDAGIVADEGALRSKTTKTGDSRYVQLDNVTVERWHALKRAHDSRLRTVDIPLSDDMYVFASLPEGTTPIRPDRVTKVWDMLRSELAINPKLEFRGLRNWHISTLDELGFDLAKIARRVGHSQQNSATAMTSHYSLADRKVDAKMAAAVGSRLDAIERLRRKCTT